MARGYLNLVLHAHLPYIKHVRQKDHIEQRWFYEAVVESYLPLAETLLNLHERGARYHITLSLSPTLCVMLNDNDLRDGCEAFIDTMIDLCEYECSRNRGRRGILSLSQYYYNRFRQLRELFTKKFGKDLISVFRHLMREGRVALMTSSATHGYLPIIEDYPQALHAQIRGGSKIFRESTGIEPIGFWLPECGYTPRIEKELRDSNVRFTILDSHGIMYARPIPRCGILRPVLGPYGIILYGRDSEVSRRVWSADKGYPADDDYRDFYDDVTYELSEDEIRRFVHRDGLRVASGIKYRKIGGYPRKDIYEPGRAEKKLDMHASLFVHHLSGVIADAVNRFGVEPVVTVAFDAELFGHWWYEGCGWLERVLSRISTHSLITMINGGDFIPSSGTFEKVTPEKSSWGYKGYNETWINPNNDWIIRLTHDATEKMIRGAHHHRYESNERTIIALNGAAREVLLLQSSDWGFLLSKDTAQAYVRSRVENHYRRVLKILCMVESGRIDEDYIERIKVEDGEFTYTDYRWFCKDGTYES